MTIAALRTLCAQIPWCEPAVLESALELALEIAREGREGRRIGTLFTVGKADAVLAASLKATSTVRVRRRERIQEEPMSTQWTQIAALATILTISGPVLAGAQSSPRKSDTYTWNGEFVSLDTTAMTMTVKSRVAYQEAISELKHFKAGDRVWIVWSGVQDSSDAVRQVRRSETARKIDENRVLPAELVSTEAPNSYITIRVKVPESGLAAIKAVKPGEWVTVTSRHRPSSDAEAVVAVRPWSHATTN